MNPHVKRALDVLCAYYADREGTPRKLNAVQTTAYSDALGRFNEAQLQQAASRWIQTSKFFPAVSDLLAILAPTVDLTTAAHLAWACVEDAIRHGGLYAGATFQQGAIGECVRQVFGSWMHACSFEADSPGWAIRRQSFLAVFPALALRSIPPVTLRGLHANAKPYIADLVEGLPEPLSLPDSKRPLSPTEARDALAEGLRRAKLRLAPKAPQEPSK